MRHLSTLSTYRPFRLALLALAGAGLSACQGHRPHFDYGSNWRPSGVVQSDLDAQLADRHDLIRGRGSPLIPASIVLPGIETWENGAGKGPNGGGSGQTGSMAGSAATGGSTASGGTTGKP